MFLSFRAATISTIKLIISDKQLIVLSTLNTQGEKKSQFSDSNILTTTIIWLLTIFDYFLCLWQHPGLWDSLTNFFAPYKGRENNWQINQ